MKNEISLESVKDIQKKINSDCYNAVCLENAAQSISKILFTEYKSFNVLTRIFITANFTDIPAKNQEFVMNFAKSLNVADKIKNNTPILSLVGSQGTNNEWNSRKNSKGHVGIPLLSNQFISGIPMMSRLLNELGINIDGIANAEITSNVYGTIQGIFYVEDAEIQKDNLGRNIIAAQDFVKKYSIKTVFGFGGQIGFSKQYLTVIMFNNAIIGRTYAKTMNVLNLPIRNIFQPYLQTKKIFC